MNVYIIYRFSDYEMIKKQIGSIRLIENIKVFYFSPDHLCKKTSENQIDKNWHEKAKEK